MPENPTISVIIPAYNAAGVILETLESLFNQSFQDFEVIVINDGSKDNTLEVLKSIKDPRLQVITIPNQGVCNARNKGIEASKGQYLAFLDHDDLWTQDKLRDQLEALQRNPNAGVAYSWTQPFYTNNPKPLSHQRYYFQGCVYDQLLMDNFIAQGSNIMVTRAAAESVGGYDPEIPFMGDWDYALRLAAQWEYVLVPKPQILYRLSNSSMSTHSDVMEKQYLTLMKRAHPLSKVPYRPLVSKHYILLISICLSRANTRRDALSLLKFFKKSFMSHPLVFLMNATMFANLLRTFKTVLYPSQPSFST